MVEKEERQGRMLDAGSSRARSPLSRPWQEGCELADSRAGPASERLDRELCAIQSRSGRGARQRKRRAKRTRTRNSTTVGRAHRHRSENQQRGRIRIVGFWGLTGNASRPCFLRLESPKRESCEREALVRGRARKSRSRLSPRTNPPTSHAVP